MLSGDTLPLSKSACDTFAAAVSANGAAAIRLVCPACGLLK